MLKNAISLNAMIYFSPAKINLGLQIIERRQDGFHNLRTLMYPIPLCDLIEINQFPSQDTPVHFTQSGLSTGTTPENNLCIRAWDMMRSEISLPPVAIHLHKLIPVGAGLGGGSSNASTVLKALNTMVDKPLSKEQLAEFAARLGSDCPFFLQAGPMLAEGRGELLSSLTVSLRRYYLVVLFPEVHISTAEAYSKVTPARPEHHLKQLIEIPVPQWKDAIRNDFEPSLFEQYPQLYELKQALYAAGALYASISGSGSSLYGIFEKSPALPGGIRKFVIWMGMH
jgi:4-diphosphocytidyl-2-C-methyl-D-erythritol kinase